MKTTSVRQSGAGGFNSTHRAEKDFGLIAPIEPVLRQSDLKPRE
jgi:hypothetical protein